MAEEDNFDIDIYGDETGQEEYNGEQGGDSSYNYGEEDGHEPMNGQESSYDGQSGDTSAPVKSDLDSSNYNNMEVTPTNHQETSNPPQGVKRKSTMDDRPIDPNSSNAVQITELHWWITEDDLRGWCVQSGCEDEVKDITFNEHKVNGKSKGQVYIEFASQAAATALKHHMDKLEARKSDPKLPIATFFHGQSNPYKTLPKDNTRRNDTRGGGGERNFSNPNQNFGSNNNFSGNFRGRGGQFNSPNRGGMNPGWNRGGFSGPMNPMGPMGGPMGMNTYGGMNNYNNFNRGGMMGGGMRGGMSPNRGGRGGMGGPGPGMMNPMGSMNMNMGMGGMGMNPGMMNMSGGFQNQPQFNPPFFQGQTAGGGDWGNPHGTKRHRPNE